MIVLRVVTDFRTNMLNAIIPTYANEVVDYTTRGQFIAIEITLNIFVGNIRLSYYVSDGILWKVPSWPLYVYIKARPLSLDRNVTKLSILSSGSIQCLDKHRCCITSRLRAKPVPPNYFRCCGGLLGKTPL